MSNHKNSLNINNGFLLLLLAIDLGFILLHFYNSVLLPDSEFNPLFSLVNDTSFAEKFQYLKWTLIAMLFIYMVFKRASLNYIPWALIFVYLLLDDSLTLHERIGGYLVKDVTGEAPLGLRFQDIGELLVTAIAGSILFSLLAIAYFRGNETFKKITKEMLMIFSILVLFGVGIDMLGQMLSPGRYLTFVLEIVEDGGEMFIASAMLWYAYIVAKANQGGIMGYLRSFLQSLHLVRT